MIRLENVSKSFGGFRLSLNCSVTEGELVSVLGPSGSGKTTALRLIAGFETPDSGRIVIDGRDVTALDPAHRRVGFVFQDYTLFPHMSVYENIAYGLRVQGRARSEIERVVSEQLSLVELPGYEARSIQTLSGGEQQRVAIARALAVDPVLLMLDEPFSSIDMILRKELRRAVVGLQKKLKITVVFVTHNQEEALAISDRVIVLRGGSIVQFDSPQALYSRPKSRFVASMTGAANFFTGAVTGREGPYLLVESIRTLRVALRGSADLSADGKTAVTLMVRPNDLRFTERRDRNAFELTPVARQYFGHYFEYLCETRGRSFTVFDSRYRELGCKLWAAFDPERAVLIPESRPVTPPSPLTARPVPPGERP